MKRKFLFAIFFFTVFSVNAVSQMENIIVAGVSASYTYSGTPVIPSPILRDRLKTLKKDVDYTLDCKNNVNVGTAVMTIKGIGNYAGEVTREFKIGKARLVVAVDAGQTKGYGKPDPKFTYKITSGELKGTDVIKGTLERQAGEDIGIYPITQGTLNAGDNYDLIVTKNNFKIEKAAITIKPTAGQSKIYGQKDPDLKYTIVEGALAGKDVFTGNLGHAMGENVGSYAITIGTLTAGKNYDLKVVPELVNFEILKADITIRANPNQTKVYGDPDPVLTYTVVSGELKNNDTFKGALSRQTGEDVGKYPIQAGTLTLSNNYNLKMELTEKLEITRKSF